MTEDERVYNLFPSMIPEYERIKTLTPPSVVHERKTRHTRGGGSSQTIGDQQGQGCALPYHPVKRSPLKRKTPLRSGMPSKAPERSNGGSGVLPYTPPPQNAFCGGSSSQNRPLRVDVGLRFVGRRGKRLAAGDLEQEADTHRLSCVCGCYADPTQNEVARAHLESRRFAATRNLDWNNLPACLSLSKWLDFEPAGIKARRELLLMARAKGDRLTPEEVGPVLGRYEYHTWRRRVASGG